jgi:membrane fusion protein (multidrug efflux system)
VQARPVAIGQSLGNNWLVTSGLQGGENVIVEGLQVVQPGMTVQATAWRADGVQQTAQAAQAAH